MQFIGERVTQDIQSKALRAVEDFIDLLAIGNRNKLYRIAQKSWKRKSFWVKKHGVEFIHTVAFDDSEIVHIKFKSAVFFTARIEFYFNGTVETRHVNFISEQRPYKTSVKAKFRYNPISLTKASVKSL